MLKPFCIPSLFGVVSVLTGTAPAVLAQADANEPSPVQDAGTAESRQSTVFTLSGSATYLGEADVDDDSGEVSVFRAGGRLGFRHSASQQLTVVGSISEEWSDYDFENAANLFPGSTSTESPFGSLHETVFTLGFDYRIDESWAAFGGGIAGFGYESGADFGDSFYAGGRAGFRYRYNDALSLGFGAGVISRLEEDTLIIPILTVQWQIDEDWRLESDGLGAKLTWSASEDLKLHGFARYSSRAYRTDENNSFLPGGAFVDSRFLLGAGATWSPAERFTISLEAGTSILQTFKFYNDSGNEISERDSDPQLMLRAGIEFRY
ncbi:MAG: DUF6268 family outer membrane beta-barrel protein [Phycisphaerales bacterium JB050]